MGKGDTYRPVDRVKYDRNYDAIFGTKCGVCKGKGYLTDYDNDKPIETTCLVCRGKGYVKKVRNK